jgi:tyrosine-protein kinase Etk/Wzc
MAAVADVAMGEESPSPEINGRSGNRAARAVAGTPAGANADPRTQLISGATNPQLVELIAVLAPYKRPLLVATLAVAVIAGIGALLIPNRYTATATILPPAQNESAATALVGQLETFTGMSPAALGAISPTDLCIAILKSRSIQSAIVDRFDLRRAYRAQRYDDARRRLDSNTEILADKEGQISISVSARDPRQAAQLANAYVEQLRALNQGLAQSEARQRRTFYESELADERKELSQAEVSLQGAEEKTGLVQPDSQTRAIVESIAGTRAQIGSAEAKLGTMRLYATPDNPELQRAQVELAGLREQLARLERGSGSLGSGKLAIPTSQLPEVQLQYGRDARNLKYHEALYQFLSKQAEAARLDEAKPAAMVQVIDEATVPDARSGPHRLMIVLVSTVVAFLLGSLFVMMRESLRQRQLSAGRLDEGR